MRSREWMKGALSGFVITALLGAGFTAIGDVREARRRPIRIAVDGELMKQGLGDALAQIDELDRLNDRNRDRRVRYRMSGKLRDLRANLGALEQHVDDAIARRGDRYQDRGRGLESDSVDEELGYDEQLPPPAQDATRYVLSDAEISRVMAELDKAYSSEAKLALIREACNGRWLTVAQLIKLMEDLSFSNDRVELAAMLYGNVADQDQFFQVYSHLPFDSDREALRKKLGR